MFIEKCFNISQFVTKFVIFGAPEGFAIQSGEFYYALILWYKWNFNYGKIFAITRISLMHRRMIFIINLITFIKIPFPFMHFHFTFYNYYLYNNKSIDRTLQPFEITGTNWRLLCKLHLSSHSSFPCCGLEQK